MCNDTKLREVITGWTDSIVYAPKKCVHQKTCINIIIYKNWDQSGSNPNADWINADWINYNVFIQRKSYSNENEWTRTICSNKDEFSQTQRWKKKDAEEKMPNDSTHTGGRHRQLNGCESEQTLRDSEGQGGLVCCSPWGKQSRTRLRNWAKKFKTGKTNLQCSKVWQWIPFWRTEGYAENVLVLDPGNSYVVCLFFNTLRTRWTWLVHFSLCMSKFKNEFM